MATQKLKRKVIKLSTFWIPVRSLRVYLRETLKSLFIYNTTTIKDLLFSPSFPESVRNASAKTLLFIDAQIPVYDRDTGSRAIYQYLLFFKKIGMNVVYLPFKPFPRGRYLNALLSEKIEVVTSDFHHYLRLHGLEFDYVYLNRPDIANAFLPDLKQFTQAKIVYQACDLHFLREKRCFEETGDKEAILRSETYKELERKIAETVDVFCSYSDIEVKTIQEMVPQVKAYTVPLYLWEKTKDTVYQAENRKNLIFVGGFGHQPNVDGTEWFLDKIFPQVVKRIPDIKFYIIGSNPPDFLLKKASENVVFTGFMPDEALDKLMSEIRLNVVPLRFGAGIKGKIVESVYNALPVITTSVGAEGIPSTEMITVCDEPDAFADKLVNLYNDTAKLNEMSAKASDFIHAYYSQSVARKKFQQIFGEEL